MSAPGSTTTTKRDRPVGIGEPAPDFTLPAVNGEGGVRASLAHYRDRRAVLLVLMRGLGCPFCRQQIAQLSLSLARFAAAGLDVLGVIDTPVDRARLYLRHRPTPLLLLSDPEFTVHGAYGVPRHEVTLAGDDAHEAIVAQGAQRVGHFLIDRRGIVRWTHVEGEEYVRRAAKFPGPREVLDLAVSLLNSEEEPS